MSLAVWLPLNGDLHNQGLSNVTVTNNGAIIDNSGKIGKCYSFNGNDSYISLSSNKLYDIFKGGSQPFSISFWVYHADTTRAVLFGDHALTGAIDFNIELTVEHKIRFYWGSSPDKSFTPAITQAQWTHIVLTYDGSKILFFKDGILQTDKYSNSLAVKNKTSGVFYLGRDSRTGTTALNGRLNDVRIYDHALSPKEVEEIAKGLVLHYPLNNNGLGNTNLALNTKNLNINGDISNLYMFKKGNATRQLRTDTFSEIKCTGSWQGIQVYANALNLSAGSKLTYSFYIYGNENSKNFYFYPLIYSSEGVRDTTTKIPISIDGSSYVSANSKLFTSTTTTTPKHHYVIFEWTQDLVDIIDNEGYILLTIQVYGTWDTGDWSCIFSPKLEFGEIPTPWAPAPSDIGYTNVIYDTSGYCNNGTIVGDITTITPSPRYNCATNFINNISGIKINNNSFSSILNLDFTFSFWIKSNDQGSRSIYFGNYSKNPAFNIEKKDNNSLRLYWNGSPDIEFSNTTITNNEWVFITIVKFSTGTIKAYLNGVEKAAKGYGFTSQSFSSPWYIGRDSRGDNTAYLGNMSDFRIYCTALSANQIKELYNTSIQIDSSGNVFARELVES